MDNSRVTQLSKAAAAIVYEVRCNGYEGNMAGVRAFVGHSFLEQDAQLVRRFTDCFDTLKQGSFDFDWTHALEARPDEISAKSPTRKELSDFSQL